MADHDKSLIDQAKDALGMGDDDEHSDRDRDDRRDEGGMGADRTDDLSRDRGDTWGGDTTGGAAGTGTGTGTTGAAGSAGTMGGTDDTTTRRESGARESGLTEDETDTGRRESGM